MAKFIKLHSAVVGQNFAYAGGETVQWPDDEEADRYIEAGMATEVSVDANGQERPVRTIRTHKPATAAKKSGSENGAAKSAGVENAAKNPAPETAATR